MQAALNPPSTVEALITAEPEPTPVIRPVVGLTDATFGLSEDQVTALLVADAGVTVAVSLSDLVTYIDAVDCERLIPVTGTVT